MGKPNKNIVHDEMPECIRLTINGKIVSAHCTICGAFIAAGQSLDRLDTVIQMHGCVRESKA